MKLGISPASQHISSPKPAQYGRCLPGVHQLSTSHFTQHRDEIVFFLTSFCQLQHVCNSFRQTVCICMKTKAVLYVLMGQTLPIRWFH